jgi:hypothetical protein
MGSRQKLSALGAQEFQHRACWRHQHLILAAKHEPLPDDGQSIDIERHQAALVELRRYRMGGTNCSASPT